MRKDAQRVHLISKERDKDDYYSTDPRSIDALLLREDFDINIWEPACGKGDMVFRLEDYSKIVRRSDIVDRGCNAELLDFLSIKEPFNGDIITNPPFKITVEFMVKALELIQPGHKVAMFLKVLHLEGIDRYNKIYSINPPKRVLVFSKRINTWRSGEEKLIGGMMAFAWYIWEKGWQGKTTLEWIKDY